MTRIPVYSAGDVGDPLAETLKIIWGSGQAAPSSARRGDAREGAVVCNQCGISGVRTVAGRPRQLIAVGETRLWDMRVCGRCECHAADGVCRLVDVMCTDECWVYGVAEYGLGFDGGGRGDMVSGEGVAFS